MPAGSNTAVSTTWASNPAFQAAAVRPASSGANCTGAKSRPSTTQACSIPAAQRVAAESTRMAPVAMWVSVSMASATAASSASAKAAKSSG